jgi:3-deoxy-D-manno-octulosonate 8-phosphate phosphatase (KDO 8-P phosphatase)
MNLQQRAAQIELMLSDVDGVLTDGSVVFDNQGIETKKFHIADGLGINLWRRAGYRFGMITGRSSHIVRLRAAELGVELVRQGVEDKLSVVQQVVAELRLRMNQVCFIGDDLPDLAVVQQVGLGMAVSDACEELRAAAHYVTKRPGGRGAVREAIETILKAQGRWDDFVQKYQGRPE